MQNGVKKDDAVYIFELVDKFAGYGFNKSHAAAYALVSYHTAYLKANYREEFLAASMTLDMGNTDKLAHVRRRGAARAASRCSRRASTPPRSISSPSRRARTAKPGAIRYSLAALKNIGAAAVATIVAERKRERAATRALADFASRAQPQGAQQARRSKRWPRPAPSTRSKPTARWCTPTSKASSRWRSAARPNAASGTDDLFGGGGTAPQLDLRPAQAWTPMERLSHEFEAVGFYLSGHPLDSTSACCRSSASSATPSSRR